MPDASFVERAEEALGNTGALRHSARFLTRGDAGLAVWFRQWARLERTAVSLCTYECRLVPGLLQSEGYVRTLCENEIPPLSDDALETTVQMRMERQQLLRERPNATFDFVIENLEAVLGEAGMSLANLVRLNVYTTDVDLLFPHYGVLASRLGAAGVAPTTTMLGVTRLAVPGQMVELEGTAVA
ncbi:Scr1 family TA system antitoxin-like transcriptional regulator [Streptomyces sp. NPDC044984]|uniref:Scr1 family TA system antitoxin-like transcriptional regulator n=1 Tax=Streptomyces sp. NPDC044984 TaxID=3154335 RepID=UPI0033C75AC9